MERVFASDSAFAAILSDGRVVTWGNPDCGGNSDSVQAELIDVQQVQSTFGAFAATLGNGQVVTWGDPSGGGQKPYDDQPKKVKDIQSTDHAFAAICTDRTVLTWGDERCGGDSSEVQDQLRQVCQIRGAAGGAFAAILENGGVGHMG